MKRNRMVWMFLFAVSVFLSLGASALAEEALPEYNISNWKPAPNPGDYLLTYGTYPEEDLRVTGGFYFDYGYKPLSATLTGTQAGTQAVVNHQLMMDLFLSFSMFNYVEISAVMPFGLYMKPQSTLSHTEPYSTMETAGVSDLRIIVKGKLLDLKEYPVGLALVVDLGTPTGQKGRFLTDDSVTVAALAALEFNPWGKARFAFNIGYRYRPTRYVFGNAMGQTLVLSGAASVPVIFLDNMDLIVDLHGEINLEPDQKLGELKYLSRDERPFEANLGVRYRFIDSAADTFWRGLSMTAALGTGIGAGTPDVRAILGLSFHWVSGGRYALDYEYGGYLEEIEECPDPTTTPPSQIPERCRDRTIDSDGDTIPDHLDKCPFKGRVGFIDEFGCAPDTDGDTIVDYEDLCPNEGERGKVDSSGCPIVIKDSDGDGLLDDVDQCPYVAETFNGYEDEDGCPDEDPNALVAITDGKINIKEQVFFETAKAVIKAESFELLDQVAQIIIDNPHIGNIEVEGHTDDKGKYKYNKKLSQSRAESVKDYLVQRGVDSARLTAIGYGPDKPIDSNETESGRAKNRRVEFTIIGIPEE